MKKFNREVHEKTTSWSILQSERLKKMWTTIITVTLSFHYRVGIFSATRHYYRGDIVIGGFIVSPRNICTDYSYYREAKSCLD